MKKIYIVLTILTSFSFFHSCTGDFIKDENSIVLSFPLNNESCEEGEKVGNQIEIPFIWSTEGNNLGNLQIQIIELDVNKEPILDQEPKRKDLANNQLEDTFILDYGKWYEWKIFSVDTDVTSETFSFFSQGEPDERIAPFPATINISSNSGGNITFSWDRPSYSGSSSLLYDVYFDQKENPETKIETDESEPVTVSQTGLTINSDYYIKVVTKENRTQGNSSISIKKVTINP